MVSAPRSSSLVLVVLALAVGCGGEPAAAPTPPLPAGPRTVVLVSLDTLRPERLGIYGNTGGDVEVSPNIDALASEAIVFDQALAPSPWTLPSHLTMLTGLDPIAHGVHNAGFAPLSRHATTLAESLRAAGFDTGAFTDGGFVEGKLGFDQGFDVYRDKRNPPGEGPNGFRRLLPEALDWMRERSDDDYFLFVHTFDVHAPYQDGDPEVFERFRARPVGDGPRDYGLQLISFLAQQTRMGLDGYARLDELLNDYDAGVNEADRGVGQILQVLEETGRLDNALIIVTSDHGESFFDHQLHVGHGLGTGDDELRVPLIVKLPTGEGQGTRRDELVGLVDLHRTVLDVFGLEPDPVTQGESLLRLVRGNARTTDHIIGASQNTRSFFLVKQGYKYVSPPGVLWTDTATRHLGPISPPAPDQPDNIYEYTLDDVTLKYDLIGDPLGLRDVLPRNEALFDRAKDPNERRNVIRDEPETAHRMREYLQRLYEQSEALSVQLFDETSDAPTIDPASQKALAALGYLAEGKREDFVSVGKALRTELVDPYVPPNTELLVQTDRVVQAIRARLRRGEGVLPGDRDALQEAGMSYRRWYDAHPEHEARVTWRAQALIDLAAQAGLELDQLAWVAGSSRPGTGKQGQPPEDQ